MTRTRHRARENEARPYLLQQVALTHKTQGCLVMSVTPVAPSILTLLRPRRSHAPLSGPNPFIHFSDATAVRFAEYHLLLQTLVQL